MRAVRVRVARFGRRDSGRDEGRACSQMCSSATLSDETRALRETGASSNEASRGDGRWMWLPCKRTRRGCGRVRRIVRLGSEGRKAAGAREEGGRGTGDGRAMSHPRRRRTLAA